MSLYKRGRIWHYDFAIAGRRYRGSTREENEERARKIEAVLIGRAAQREPSLLPRRAPLLSDFSARFLEWVDASPLEPKSKLYYRNGWKMIAATKLAGMRLDRIATDDVGAVRFPGSAANANNALRTLRRMLGKAVEWRVLPYAPRIKLLKEYGRSALIEPQAEAKLLGVARQPLKDVLLIMLDAGMRPQEVFRMRWEHISWTAGTIFIPFGKTRNARRYVPISQRVRASLEERLFRALPPQALHRLPPTSPVEEAAAGLTGWVFQARSKCGHLTTVGGQWYAARTAAGLPASVVLYSARHTFATHALAATGNLAAVMRAMGHSSAQTAMIYQHPGIEAIRKAVDEKNCGTAALILDAAPVGRGCEAASVGGSGTRGRSGAREAASAGRTPQRRHNVVPFDAACLASR